MKRPNRIEWRITSMHCLRVYCPLSLAALVVMVLWSIAAIGTGWRSLREISFSMMHSIVTAQDLPPKIDPVIIERTDEVKSAGSGATAPAVNVASLEDLLSLEPVVGEDSYGGKIIGSNSSWNKAGDGKNGHQKEGKQLIVFVHVYKTAGSTLSTLFKSYSQLCRRGYARFISCTGVDAQSILDGGTWRKCTLKKGVHRNTGIEFDTGKKGKVNSTFIRKDLDIVAGHLRLGSMDALDDCSGDCGMRQVQYVSFFRDAASKYISGVVYSSLKKGKLKSIRYIIDKIKRDVRADIKRGKYHFRYENYLITPFQQLEWRKRNINLGLRERAELIKKNLVDYNVTVGIVERMADSLELLYNLVGQDEKAKDVFTSFGMRDGRGVSSNRRANQSPVSASKILAELRKDDDFYPELKEYVKYEQMITDFALAIHTRQYKEIQTYSHSRH